MERYSDQPSQNMLHAQSLFLTHLLLGILQKIVFLKLIKLFSGHCLATTSQNAVRELSTSQSLLFQVQSISFQHLIMLRKQNFKLVFRLKRDTAVVTFIFRFLSSHWYEMFGKTCWMIGLDRRKCRWVVVQDFKGNGCIVKHEMLWWVGYSHWHPKLIVFLLLRECNQWFIKKCKKNTQVWLLFSEPKIITSLVDIFACESFIVLTPWQTITKPMNFSWSCTVHHISE